DRQAARRAEHERGGLHSGGQLLPHAHRRRAVTPTRRRPRHAPRGDPGESGGRRMSRAFPEAASEALRDAQLRRNLRVATHTIRDKRAAVVAEVDDWERLRDEGKRIKERAMRDLDAHLERLEASVTAAGGTVHWA